MDIPGINANDPTSILSQNSQTIGAQRLGRNEFLQLFVAQLENQDPLDPVQNEDFVAQLASISSVEQLETLNSNIVASIALNQSNALLSQLTTSSALIGKDVTVVDPDTGIESFGRVESVKIQNGLAVLDIGGRDVPLATVSVIHGESDETNTTEDEE